MSFLCHECLCLSHVLHASNTSLTFTSICLPFCFCPYLYVCLSLGFSVCLSVSASLAFSSVDCFITYPCTCCSIHWPHVYCARALSVNISFSVTYFCFLLRSSTLCIAYSIHKKNSFQFSNLTDTLQSSIELFIIHISFVVLFIWFDCFPH